MGCCGEECACRKFGLSYDNPSLFVNAQCFKPPVYAIWSGLWALFFFSMLMLDIYYSRDQGGEYFTFLTNLTYIFQNATLMFDFIVTLYVYSKRQDIRDGKACEMTWYLRLLWVMFNITNTVSLMVSIGYYSTLEPVFSHGSINTHLINSVHTLLNIFFCAKPVQILHFYQPMIYGSIYVIFTIIYHVLGADPIYEPLDWSDTLRTGIGTAILVFVVAPAKHVFILYSFYTMRVYFSSCCCNSKVSPESQPIHGQNGGQHAGWGGERY